MSRVPARVPAFDYIGGREFTEKLKEVTGCSNYNLLADYFGIPKSTLLTWHTHNRTGFELIVREHLKSGASIRYMALGEGEPFECNAAENTPTEGLKAFKLTEGQLIESGSVALDLATLERFGLKPSITKVIEDDSGIYYVNSESTNPTSGKYLIDIDGQLSINFVQRLPAQKLSISIGDNCFEANVNDVKVLGRVAMSMIKE